MNYLLEGNGDVEFLDLSEVIILTSNNLLGRERYEKSELKYLTGIINNVITKEFIIIKFGR